MRNQNTIASDLVRANEQISDLQETVRQCQEVIIKQHDALNKMMGEPLSHGTLLELRNQPDINRFEREDEVLVIDEKSPHHNKVGLILFPPNNDQYVSVKLLDMAGTVADFTIDQLRLTAKEDGTSAIILTDGKYWEVPGGSDFGISKGDSVKICPNTKKIVGKGYELQVGPICTVAAVHEDGVEIEEKGEKRFVSNLRDLDIQLDDRVMVDTSFSFVVRKLPKENHDRYRINEPSTCWDDIGGLTEAKKQIRMAIELPFEKPEIFQHYNLKKVRGILLYGPPGNGKTMIAKAAAHALSQIHGKEFVNSGYLYIKGPEILDKWIGNTERIIRSNFEEGRRHYREYGYPAIHVYDEADAIMPQRGSRRSSDIADTMVPMFLAEMDGADEDKTKMNPIIFLLSNRADSMDPAITRPGRINRHIKIDRPNMETGLEILKIYTRDVPFARDGMKDAVLAITISDVFSKSRILYRINNELDFTFGDMISGAMLSGIVEEAKEIALQRDLNSNTITGVMGDDFRSAVQHVYEQQRGINHSYDLADFLEKMGLQPEAKIERCFGSA